MRKWKPKRLIPGLPLDGGRVLRATLWKYDGCFRSATCWASRVGQGVAYLFIFEGVGQMLMDGFSNGLWTVFIGWFLGGAATSSQRQVVLRDKLSGITAGEVMSRQYVTVSGDTPLDRLIGDHVGVSSWPTTGNCEGSSH